MSKTPQEPWRSRWPQERDVEQSAPTHARHTHCASRQLGTAANQRYDVPRDWLWEACHMARVHWRTCCREFCCKEGLHYWTEQSVRNPLKRKQVWRALGKLSRSCHQTSNNQPLFTSWEILWGFLACTALTKRRLMSRKKMSVWGFYVRRKGMIHDRPMDVCMRNLRQKAKRGKETCTNSCNRFPQASYFEKTRHVCQKYGGECMT